MLNRSIVTIVFLLFAPSVFSADVPTWMRQAASANISTYDKDVPAVIVHSEQQVTLGADGKLVTVDNFAVKLLTNNGRAYAVARAYYLVSAGRVREIEGW